MKNKILQILGLIITVICLSQTANCQTTANGLAVSAEGSLLADTNAPQLFLTVHLFNTSTNEIVVLTKKLNCDFDLDNPNKWICTLGYKDPGVTYQGHLIIPSVSDFSPVTIKPNEEAIITQLVDQSMLLKHLKKETQIAICYAIASDWGSRLGTWSGSIMSKPFVPALKESH
ncbi:MAG TPA: hypothetical protein VE344_08985 [Methylomirabilota bacterium]|nr:hypothetical protein [Methylomirabilota bacterium]